MKVTELDLRFLWESVTVELGKDGRLIVHPKWRDGPSTFVGFKAAALLQVYLNERLLPE